jgi:radical SAM superfamily enzyme YgiQ (UPF0313 family)
MSYNFIFLSDTPQQPYWLRGHGAHQLASILRARGYSCLVIDFISALPLNIWEDICSKAVGDDTLMVGISTTWLPFRIDGISFTDLDMSDIGVHNKGNSFTTALVNNDVDMWFSAVRRINPKVKIVAGGPKIDFYSDINFDHLFVGFSETQLIDFIEDKKRIWPRVIQHDTQAQSSVWDFRQSAVSYTDIDQIEPQESLSLELTRGCRFKCAFCSFPLIGRKDFASTAKCSEVLYRELNDNYQKWGITNYHLSDDTFNDTTDKLLLLQSVTNKLSFKLSLTAYTRVDVIANNLEQTEILHDIGLVSTWMGIDSFHPLTSKVIGKGMKAEKRMRTLEHVKSVWGNDVYLKIGYIAGLPHEDSLHLQQTIDWLVASPVDAVMVNPLRLMRPGPFPNTVRSDMDINYQRYGYSFPDDDFVNWTKDDGTDINTYQQAVAISKQLNRFIEDNGKRIVNENLRNGFSDPRLYHRHLVSML